MQIEEEQNWMTPYLEYQETGKLPEDKAEAQKIAAKVANYQEVRGNLIPKGEIQPVAEMCRLERGNKSSLRDTLESLQGS